ncbi:hypothetical protein [Paraburkholderia solisilvae]|uniref:hypothetical protein n=1 Tax=Paraburkholderia solisilvae TaxID=624376 RepID=UPI0015832921|nr:hypothetical protein [Paraburkholderia solisilvae]
MNKNHQAAGAVPDASGIADRFDRTVQPHTARCKFTTRQPLNSAADKGTASSFQAAGQLLLHRNGAKNDVGNSPLQSFLARHHIEIERDSRVA